MDVFSTFVKDQVTIGVWVYFWVFNSIPLIYLPVTVTEEYRMAEKHLKKCSTFLIIREMQIKTTLRFHLTSVRMAKIRNSGDRRCW